jgi:hypothetical protein
MMKNIDTKVKIMKWKNFEIEMAKINAVRMVFQKKFFNKFYIKITK